MNNINNENDGKKILWLLGLILIWILTLELHVYFSTLLLLYALYMGAIFRGNNWFIGFQEVSTK